MGNTAKDFIQTARENEDLRLEIENAGQDVEALVALAKIHGYEFSVSDFIAAVRQAGYEADVKLTDEELETVSGATTTYSVGKTNCGEDSCDCPNTDWPDC